MRRLARWLFTFGSVVSLLLCAATAALWARSEFRHDNAYYLRPCATAKGEPSWDSWRVMSGDGRLSLDRMQPTGLWLQETRTQQAERGQ
jgi:hypothetical protein